MSKSNSILSKIKKMFIYIFKIFFSIFKSSNIKNAEQKKLKIEEEKKNEKKKNKIKPNDIQLPEDNNKKGNDFLTEKEITNLIDDILNKEYKIEKDFINIDKFKEKEIKKIKNEIVEKSINSKKEIYSIIKKDIKKEFEKANLSKNFKEQKKQNYSLVKLPKKEKIKLPIKEAIKQNHPTNKKIVLKDDNLIKKTPKIAKKSKLIIPPMQEVKIKTIDKDKNKDIIKSNIITSSLLTTNVSKNLIKKANKKEDIKLAENIKQIKKDINQNSNNIKIKQSIENLQSENIKNSPISIKKDKVKQIKKKDKELINKIIIQQKSKKITDNKESNKQKDNKTKKVILETINTNIISESINKTIKNTKDEIYSNKEIEDKEYDKYIEEINNLLYELELYKIKYDQTLSPSQKQNLSEQEHKLRKMKFSILDQKNKDLQKEHEHFEQIIQEKEIRGLKEKLKQLHIEQKLEINNKLLGNIENIEKMTKNQIANLDKQLLIKNLRKASLLTEITSILAFPFIRTKYFFFFTVGLIIDNHFNFINAWFYRKIDKFTLPDFSSIKKGKDALDKATNQTYDNLLKLNAIEEEALCKYPELEENEEFIFYITKLKHNLTKNYNKLVKKDEIMNKYYYKTKKKTKKLIKYTKKAS